MNDEKMLIGWSEISITPEKSAALLGQFIERISEYVESEITVTALALSLGSDHAVICACDVCGISSELVAEVRKRISGLCDGLDPSKVIISATHTHTSLRYRDGIYSLESSVKILERYLSCEKEVSAATGDSVITDDEVFELLAERISEAVIKAWSRREEGHIEFAFGRAAIGMCRRACYTDGSSLMWGDTSRDDFYNFEAGNDSGIELMYFFDKEGNPSGAAVNLSCPAQVLEHRAFISSDYWGKVKNRLRKKFGSNFRVLGLCAPAGDQCPRDLIRWVEPESPIADPNIKHEKQIRRRADSSMFDISGAEVVGRRIADEVIGVYDSGEREVSEPYFKHTVKELQLPIRRVTKEDRDHAEKMIKEAAAAQKKGYFDYEESAFLYVYAGTIARYETQDTEKTVKTELHTIRIGDIAISTNPFELFLDYGNKIRSASPAAQTFLIQLSCGSYGYLPTEKAEKGGHYSAYVSSGITGHEGGNLLVKEALDEINSMF